MAEKNGSPEITNMEEALEKLEQEDNFIGTPKKGANVSVHVLEAHGDELVVEIGAKSEGIIQNTELVNDIEEYAPGDSVKGVITYFNEEEGHIRISERKRAMKETLEKLKDYYNDKKPVQGKIVSRNKGGYLVSLFSVIQAFLPASQSMLRRNEKAEGLEMEFEIIDLKFRKRGRPNIVLSRKKLHEKEISAFLDNIDEGKMVEGTVEGIEKFGVFVDLGPVTGLIPRSELTYDRELNPREVVDLGDPIKAIVLRVDKKEEKVTLSRKELQPDPWKNVTEKYPVGSRVKGEVIRILPFGFVVKIEPGLEGLVHSSEIFWTNRRMDIRSIVDIGETVEVEVIGVDTDKRKMSLSLKRVKGNPWENVEEKFPIGEVFDAKIVKILPSGVIAELDDDISGFVHVTELSWNFLDNIEDVYSVGDEVKVYVMEVLPEQQRIRLSIRKVTEDPWEKAHKELKKGDEVKGKIVRLTNTGAIVLLDDYNIEAFLPVSQISVDRVETPEDALNVGDEINANVVRTVYEPEKERRNMVISIKQKMLEEEKDDYKQYMDDDASRVTLDEIVKQKESE